MLFPIYPFIPEEKYRTYICADEIENIIFNLFEEIKKIIDYERTYRDDFFIRDIYETYKKIELVTKNLHKVSNYNYGYTHILETGKNIVYIFESAQLIHLRH